MAAGRAPHPPPTNPSPVIAFTATPAGLPTRRCAGAPLSHATVGGTARPVGRSPLARRQQRRALAPTVVTMVVPAPEVWHLAPMVLAEQGAPAAAMAFEAFCAGPAAAAAALRRGGGGGGGGRRRGGRDGFVPVPPPEREAAEVVMHPGWELF